jgi:uncharacterized repeat protein (TIGR03843 family)
MVVRVRAPEPDPASDREDERGADDVTDAAALERALMDPAILHAVYKPTAGERPLFDFPIGTLTRREVAAFLVSEAMGWGIVPPTVLRDGPFGEGMVQQWIVRDEAVDVVGMIQADDPRLRRHAIFDAIVNNTDRKGGHLIPVPGGHVYGVDHGVTFSVVPKLRTILWAWEGERFERDEVVAIERVREGLRADLGDALLELLKRGEVLATRRRTEALLRTRVFPGPSPDWPAVPWPPF